MVWPLPRPWSETMVSIPLWAQKTLEIMCFLGLERPFLDLVSQTPRPRGRGRPLFADLLRSVSSRAIRFTGDLGSRDSRHLSIHCDMRLFPRDYRRMVIFRGYVSKWSLSLYCMLVGWKIRVCWLVFLCPPGFLNEFKWNCLTSSERLWNYVYSLSTSTVKRKPLLSQFWADLNRF